MKTQRYRIYDYVIGIFLDADKFERIVNISNSGVLLLNKANNNLAELKTLISNMFIEIYPDLENDLNQ